MNGIPETSFKEVVVEEQANLDSVDQKDAKINSYSPPNNSLDADDPLQAKDTVDGQNFENEQFTEIEKDILDDNEDDQDTTEDDKDTTKEVFDDEDILDDSANKKDTAEKEYLIVDEEISVESNKLDGKDTAFGVDTSDESNTANEKDTTEVEEDILDNEDIADDYLTPEKEEILHDSNSANTKDSSDEQYTDYEDIGEEEDNEGYEDFLDNGEDYEEDTDLEEDTNLEEDSDLEEGEEFADEDKKSLEEKDASVEDAYDSKVKQPDVKLMNLIDSGHRLYESLYEFQKIIVDRILERISQK